MSWKEKLSKLPVKTIITNDDGTLVDNYRKCQYMACKTYMPNLGTTYYFMFSGSMADSKILIDEISAEFDQPSIDKDIEDGKRIVVWQTGTKEYPDTITFQVLGRERVETIARERGLTENEIDILMDIFVIRDSPLMSNNDYVDYALNRCQHLEFERHILILSTHFQILAEFMNKKFESIA